MAVVYLPLGYPELGGTFSTVVYQGTMARRYVVPNDPRTDSQVFQRNLLSDVSKVRASAGRWAKAAWKLQFGSKAASVIYQMVKANPYGFWGNAWDEFDGFDDVTQQNWRDLAPFAVTYNDPGRIFFALAKMLYMWGEHSGNNFYKMDNPTDWGADETAGWWTADIDQYGWQVGGVPLKWIHDLDIQFDYFGSWSSVADGSANDDYLKQTSTPGDYVQIQVNAKQFQMGYVRHPSGANVEVKVDSSVVGLVNTNGTLLYGVTWGDVWRQRTKRIFRMTHAGSPGEVFKFDGVALDLRYTYNDVDFVFGTWVPWSTGGPSGSDGYESTLTGDRALEFNFVGSWLALFYKTDSTMGTMRVIVDGEVVDIFNQYSPTVDYLSRWLGRFRKTLHHCRLEATGSGQINIQYFWVTSKYYG